MCGVRVGVPSERWHTVTAREVLRRLLEMASRDTGDLYRAVYIGQPTADALRCHMQSFGDQMGDQFPELVDEVHRLVDAAAGCLERADRG